MFSGHFAIGAIFKLRQGWTASKIVQMLFHLNMDRFMNSTTRKTKSGRCLNEAYVFSNVYFFLDSEPSFYNKLFAVLYQVVNRLKFEENATRKRRPFAVEKHDLML